SGPRSASPWEARALGATPGLLRGGRRVSRGARMSLQAPWSRPTSFWILPQVALISRVAITHAGPEVQTARASASSPRCAVLGVAEADRWQAVGLDVRVGEDAGAVLGEVDLRLDGERRAVAGGRELRHDLAVVGREGDGTGVGDQRRG